MSTLDFTFSIPVTLPVPPLEATGADQAVSRAPKVVTRPESDVLVEVSPSARARAGSMPLFAEDDAGPDATDNEDRNSGNSGAQLAAPAQEEPANDRPARGLAALAERMSARNAANG